MLIAKYITIHAKIVSAIALKIDLILSRSAVDQSNGAYPIVPCTAQMPKQSVKKINASLSQV